MLTRFIYKNLNGQTVGVDGREFDSHTEMVRVWDASETDHVWTVSRKSLVDSETVNILWFDDDGDLKYVGCKAVS